MISNLARATADLHCHSSASGPNGNWWYAQLGLADCKTPPEEVYTQAKAAGMTFVVLTDHDSIDGALELAHHPDFIVGEEVTVVFADDGMRIDVVVLGLDERQHLEIQARRDDAHILVRYLRAERLVHFLAHPIYDPGNALEPTHLDRLAALFPLWETRNGARLPEANELAARLLPDMATHRRLAAEFGFESSPQRTGGVGGSDDHGGIDIGTTYTLTPPAANVEEFLEHLRAGRCRPAGLHADPARMTHMVARLLDRHRTGPLDEQRLEIWGALADGKLEHRDVARLAEALAFGGGGGDDEEPALPFSDPNGVGRQLQTLRRYARSQARLIPYLTVQAYLAREREGARRLASRTGGASARGGIRVALLADGLGSINGVAETYRELLPHLPDDVRVTAIGCGKARGIDVLEVSRAATLAFPLYPELDLPLPHLSEVSERVFDSDADVIHVSGPGPLGLAGLAAAKLLRLPLVATYHTELSDYARALSDDPLLAELAHAATSRFYAAADLVVAPSRATAHRLRTLLGIPEDRIALVPQGVDCLRFAPEHRHADLSRPDDVTVLCVARLSKEKTIERLVDAHALLGRDNVSLVIVGDGPARQALEERAAGRATFTGWLEGEALSQAFASADLFLLPSTTETCGQVVLEAQASGLPCVVSGQGAVREAVIPGVSGIVVEWDTAAAYATVLETLVEDTDRRSHMSRKARENALTRTWVEAADELTHAYRRLVQNPDVAVTELLTAG